MIRTRGPRARDLRVVRVVVVRLDVAAVVAAGLARTALRTTPRCSALTCRSSSRIRWSRPRLLAVARTTRDHAVHARAPAPCASETSSSGPLSKITWSYSSSARSMKSIRSWLSSSSVGLTGFGPAGHDRQVRHLVSWTHCVERGQRVEHVAEALVVGHAEHVVELGAAEVGVDQQDPPAVQRQARGEVARHRRLAVAGARAGDQDAPGRVQRRRVLQLGCGRWRNCSAIIECGASKITSGSRAPADWGSSLSCGTMPSRLICPTRAMSRGERIGWSVSSRRNAMPSDSASPRMIASAIVIFNCGKLLFSGTSGQLYHCTRIAAFDV